MENSPGQDAPVQDTPVQDTPGQITPGQFTPGQKSAAPDAPETPSNLTVTPEQLGLTTADYRPFLKGEFAGIELGRYLILEKLGEGGMGLVFRARDNVLGREVALKLIKSGLLAGEQEVKRFYREAQSVAQFNHPHIIKIYDFGQVQGQPYFTMALASSSLGRHVKRLGEQPWAVATVMSKIARAVQYIHEHDLLHRDLKPGNILMDSGDEPLISDFGLARPIESSELTRPGDAPGTLLYMAPEQAARRPADVGPPADIWALGVIFYEILCSQKPFTGTNEEDARAAIQHREPTRPRRLRKGLDVSLDTIVMKCLEKAPQHRYASAGALADDIDHWLRGEPIKARPFPWWRKVLRGVRRHPVLAGMIVLLLLGLLAIPVVKELTDPERIVKTEILPKLAAGEAVTLIGEKEDPKWYRWRLPGVVNPKKIGEPVFNLSSGTKSLLELLPGVPLDRYRFSAEARIDNFGKAAGIYCGYIHHGGDAHSFILLGHSKPNKKAFLERVCYSPVSTTPYPGSVTSSFGGIITNTDKTQWHQLKMEITPEFFISYFDEAMVHSTPIKTSKLTNNYSGFPRPNMSAVTYEFSVRNGLGLYVEEGSVSFRNVVVEPF